MKQEILKTFWLENLTRRDHLGRHTRILAIILKWLTI